MSLKTQILVANLLFPRVSLTRVKKSIMRITLENIDFRKYFIFKFSPLLAQR